MSEGSNQFNNEQQRRNREERARNIRGTLETYTIEKGNANNLPIPAIVVNILAVIGGLTVLYLLANLIF
ncbi:MAG: hypothetical protein OHK0046_22170 [Anaerolineae bacterium]